MRMLVAILAIGIIVAAKSFRDSALTEFADYAQAIGNLDQNYNVPDVVPGDGSGFIDARDFCDTAAATATTTSNTTGSWGSGVDEFGGNGLEFGIAPPGE